VFQLSGVQARGIAGLVKESQGLLLTPEERLSSLAPSRSALIGKGMAWSPNHGDTAFTVPMFDEFMKRSMPENDWR